MWTIYHETVPNNEYGVHVPLLKEVWIDDYIVNIGQDCSTKKLWLIIVLTLLNIYLS